MRSRIELNDSMSVSPAQWRTVKDMLHNISASFSLEADRTLYSLIPKDQLPDREMLDRVLVIDGKTVQADIRLDEGILWLNEEPISLSLLFGEQLNMPLWPAFLPAHPFADKNLADEYASLDEQSTREFSPELHGGQSELPQHLQRDQIEDLRRQNEALQAEIARLDVIRREAVESLRRERELAELAALYKQELAEKEQALAMREGTLSEENARDKAESDAEHRDNDALRQEARHAQQRSLELARLRNRYFSVLRQSVERQWHRPSGTTEAVDCTVIVLQNRGGEILRVIEVTCAGGGHSLRSSVESAVLAASPLPAAPDRSLFDSRIKFYFRPG